MEPNESDFIWDQIKEQLNIIKHGVDFKTATRAFADARRQIYVDTKHSSNEERHFCLGRVDGKVLTVRFLYREGTIRIIGAGFWRKGERLYDQED
jgi:uncharacterized protein